MLFIESWRNKRGLSVSAPGFMKLSFLAASFFSAQLSLAEEVALGASDEQIYAAGLTIGSEGFGANISAKTPWKLMTHDQLQWRVMMSGLSVSDDDAGLDYGSVEYQDIDLSMFTLQGGLDWYPFQGWANSVFFSAGLMFSDRDFSGVADTTKSFSVGGQSVSPGDVESFKTDIEQSGVLPYLSVGWGNKITGRRGFNFQAEVGVAAPTSKADVKLAVVDSNNVISANNLAAEKKDIEDDFNDVRLFAMATVTYHF